MNKYIYTILTLSLASLFSANHSKAFASDPFFSIPEEVCMGHEITPEDVIDSDEYSWSFCMPNLDLIPEGYSQIPRDQYQGLQYIQTGEFDGQLITFALNGSGRLVQIIHEEGTFMEEPLEVNELFSVPTSNGFQLLFVDNEWYIFLISNQGVGIQLTRLEFPNGLNQEPIIGHNQILNATQTKVTGLIIQKEITYDYTGFIFTEDNEMYRLKFDNGILQSPNIENLGNPGNLLNKPTDFFPYFEDGYWHLFVVNRGSERLSRFSFLSLLSNAPAPMDLGNYEGRLKRPSGITFLQTCENKYIYILNEGSESMIQLKWDNNQPITAIPTPKNRGNLANFVLPTALSNPFIDVDNRIFMLIGNADNTMSFVYYDECDAVSYDADDIANPTFKYNAPGTYTITLRLPDGRSYCKDITITHRPDINYTEDTLICQGDSIILSATSYGSLETFWEPDYNINNTTGQIVHVAPEFDTRYRVETVFADNCIVKHTIKVDVSRISVDAGEDRIIKDGSTTLIGGPNTSIGENYSYLWTPDIGMIESNAKPFTRVEPPFNTTYYLNVYNEDGCHSIDSVLVEVPCDDIHMPNAFTPMGQNPLNNTFGLKNLQIAKLNYFAIYDRWGNEVFYTENPNEEWDGTYNGKEATPGVYVWQVDGYCANTEERHRKSGNVTLIR